MFHHCQRGEENVLLGTDAGALADMGQIAGHVVAEDKTLSWDEREWGGGGGGKAKGGGGGGWGGGHTGEWGGSW